MFKLCVLVLAFIAKDCSSQDEDGPYRGKFIGKLNSYHHQVSGDVYAVDEWTLVLVDFNYDGTGEDTFFWAGDSGRPGPQGFIVPDQHGKTNILERYYNEDVRLTLPEGKRISRIKWLAVYDINTQNAFGDVYIPDDFDAPAPAAVGPLTGVAAFSQQVQLVDAATILIPGLRYDGSGEEVYFWTGVGPQPSAKGTKIPDEYGYLESIRAYAGEDVTLELPAALTVFDVDWLALYDAGRKQILASVLLPDAPNVPPSSRATHPHKGSLPHCRQLHRDLQVGWEVFGPQVTLQLTGRIAENEYMAFGISGSPNSSRMVGADIAVTSYDAKLQRGLATDYNVTDKAPCVSVLGAWRGVCRDDVLGGQDSNQVFTASRDNGLTIVTYRRVLQPVEAMDREWVTDRPIAVVWAVGRLDADGAPSYHTMYPRGDVFLHLGDGSSKPDNDCGPFAVGSRPLPAPWETAQLFDPALRVFRLSVGPSGARRGLWGRGRPAPAAAWYVNGQLAPALQLRRGLHYTFKVFGGNDPHSARWYHPLIITTEPRGGLERLPLRQQQEIRVLAGATHTRRQRLSPAAAGPLCRADHAPGADPRRTDDFPTFRAWNRTLEWACPAAPASAPAELKVSPNSSWPDVVYYNSFTHADMGGRIYIVDRHRRNLGRDPASASALGPAPAPGRAPGLGPGAGPHLVLLLAAAGLGVGALARRSTGC